MTTVKHLIKTVCNLYVNQLIFLPLLFINSPDWQEYINNQAVRVI